MLLNAIGDFDSEVGVEHGVNSIFDSLKAESQPKSTFFWQNNWISSQSHFLLSGGVGIGVGVRTLAWSRSQNQSQD